MEKCIKVEYEGTILTKMCPNNCKYTYGKTVTVGSLHCLTCKHLVKYDEAEETIVCGGFDDGEHWHDDPCTEEELACEEREKNEEQDEEYPLDEIDEWKYK